MKKFIAALATVALSVSIAQAQALSGTFPAEGGAITVTASGGDVAAAGLDFVSPNGGLRPTGGVPAPFAFLLSDTSSQITYGNLGSTVTIADGASLTLSAGANADAEVEASWGMGAIPVAFPVGAAGPVVPEPATGAMALMAFAGLGMLRRRR